MREPAAVEDFYDEEEVRRVYYPEMDRLVKAVTGCAKVVVFDHTIRVDDSDLLPKEEAERRLEKRFGSINIWRPIEGPVATAPLAICEWDSINDKDLIVAERHYQGRVGGVYHLSYNPDQRWYYFPDMEREEIFVIKCFDSLNDGTARWTAHGAFDDPTSPADAPRRESIEIRTLYFFD
jgi:hypothetical protein